MLNVPQRPGGRGRNTALRLHEPSAESDEPAEGSSGGSRRFGIFSARWLIAAVAISFLLEAAIIYWFRGRTPSDAPLVAGEIPLGSFEFSRTGGANQKVYRGQFDLFVRLSDQLDASQQQQFLREQPRLQQVVEETVRRLRLADFTDYRLSRLKARVEERLNDELGFTVVSEVLIANFKISAFQPIRSAAPPSAAPSSDRPADAP
jgi:hypothetical protein